MDSGGERERERENEKSRKGKIGGMKESVEDSKREVQEEGGGGKKCQKVKEEEEKRCRGRTAEKGRNESSEYLRDRKLILILKERNG